MQVATEEKVLYVVVTLVDYRSIPWSWCILCQWVFLTENYNTFLAGSDYGITVRLRITCRTGSV